MYLKKRGAGKPLPRAFQFLAHLSRTFESVVRQLTPSLVHCMHKKTQNNPDVNHILASLLIKPSITLEFAAEL